MRRWSLRIGWTLAQDVFEDVWARYLDGVHTGVPTVKPSVASVAAERRTDNLTLRVALPTVSEPPEEDAATCGYHTHRGSCDRRSDGTAVCAICHPAFRPTAAAGVGQAAASAANEARTALLDQAAGQGWPTLEFAPGRSVSAGEVGWGIFVSRASDFDIGLARTAIIASERPPATQRGRAPDSTLA